MGVTLYHPSTGSPTHSVELPYAAHGQPVEVGMHQNLGKTASGVTFVQQHGHPWYRITQRFEGLDEDQIKLVIDFLAAVNYAGSEIRRRYLDTGSGAYRNVFCKIVYPTKQTKLNRANRDLMLVFEQRTHPDHVTDEDSEAETPQGGGTVGDGEFDEPAITSAPAAYGKVGEAFSFTLEADGAATITFGASGMPAWMSRVGAVLSGTPGVGQHGITAVTVTATNGSGVDTKSLSVRIEIQDAEPVVDEFPPVVFDDGVFFVHDGVLVSKTLVVSGDRPLTWGTPTGSLPPGMSWNATTMTVSGTITGGTHDVYTWSADVTNDAGTDTATLVFNVEVAPSVTAGDGDKTTWEGDVVSWPLTVVGYEGATQTPGGSLPSGLTYDEATRTVSGTVDPDAEGDYTFTVEFENEFGSDTATFNISVVPLVPAITSDLFDLVDESSSISIPMAAVGKPTITWSLSGEPGWLSIHSTTGVISGTAPTVASGIDNYTFDVIATNGEGNDTREFSLDVEDVP